MRWTALLAGAAGWAGGAGVQVLEDRAVLRNFRGGGQPGGAVDLNHDPLGQAHAQETPTGADPGPVPEGALNVLLSHRPGLLEEYGAGALMWCSADTPTGTGAPAACGSGVRPGRGPVSQAYRRGVSDGETRMVVSRAGQRHPYPRLWNGPELVVVTMRRTGT